MKIEKKNSKLRLLRESAAGAYYIVTKHENNDNYTEYEVVKGPRQQIMDYVVEEAVAFLDYHCGSDVDFGVFQVGPGMADQLSGSDQDEINKVVADILEYKAAIFTISSSTATSEYVMPFALATGSTADFSDLVETPEFKNYLTNKLKSKVETAFREYFES